jgi:hypothetical protein
MRAEYTPERHADASLISVTRVRVNTSESKNVKWAKTMVAPELGEESRSHVPCRRPVSRILF